MREAIYCGVYATGWYRVSMTTLLEAMGQHWMFSVDRFTAFWDEVDRRYVIRPY